MIRDLVIVRGEEDDDPDRKGTIHTPRRSETPYPKK
jgi:hypothetical protein